MTVRLAAVLVLALAFQGARRGGPQGSFLSTTPDHDLTVTQSAPHSTGSTLTLMATRDLSVSLWSETGEFSSSSLALKANVPQSVTISGLKPESRTPYRVRYESGQIDGGLITPKATKRPFTFAIQADSHLDENSSGDVYARVLQQMSNDKPDFLIDLGDTFMTGKHPKFEDAIAQYRAQRYYFGIVGKDAPIMLALGNHDGETGWVERGQTGMTEWARTQREAHFLSGYASRRGLYYVTHWGDLDAFVLDPFTFTQAKAGRARDNWTWTLGKVQYDWLQRELGNSKARFKMVFIHHLVGGAGKDARGGSEASIGYEWGGKNEDGTDGFAAHRPGWAMPIHDLLKKYGVSAVFRGHDHLYVHQERDGIAYQLVPQPSHRRGDSIQSAEEYGYQEGTILGSSGYLRVSVGAQEAKVEYVKVQSDGKAKVADQYSLH